MRQLTPYLWQISGFPPNIINMYMLSDGEECVLVDAGTRYIKRSLLKELDAFFAAPEHSALRLAAHALTHAHPDHQGASKAVCELYGVPLWCGEADAETMERGVANSPDMQGFLGILGRAWSGPAYPVSRRLNDGDLVAGYRVVETPGHTPGHLAFWREEDGSLILGDVLNGMNLMTGLPGLNEPPSAFTADVSRNRRSIAAMAALKPTLVCFGHGAPLRKNAAERLEAFARRFA
jgi:glyoxylase-like metal-dependent hydrolase (beta-lactamase superfamily II)